MNPGTWWTCWSVTQLVWNLLIQIKKWRYLIPLIQWPTSSVFNHDWIQRSLELVTYWVVICLVIQTDWFLDHDKRRPTHCHVKILLHSEQHHVVKPQPKGMEQQWNPGIIDNTSWVWNCWRQKVKQLKQDHKRSKVTIITVIRWEEQ